MSSLATCGSNTEIIHCEPEAGPNCQTVSVKLQSLLLSAFSMDYAARKVKLKHPLILNQVSLVLFTPVLKVSS